MRARRLTAALVAALTAAACAAPAPEAPPADPPAAATAADEPAPAAHGSHGASGSRDATAPENARDLPADEAAAPAPGPAPDAADAAETAARPPPPDPADLYGMSETEIDRLMGTPDLRRVDDPAALRQYRAGDCILDLFLYADGPVYRVTHVEVRARPGSGGPADPARCLARLLPDRGSRG